MPLSEKSRGILQAIAEGHSFEQILSSDRDLSYHDIFEAAAEALECIQGSKTGTAYSLDEVRAKYPRAYEKWEMEEDADLAGFFRSGLSPDEIAQKLQRQPSAVRSRLLKLHLTSP